MNPQALALIQLIANLAVGAMPMALRFIQNPEDRAKAEVAGDLFARAVRGLESQLPDIVNGIVDPASINLEKLFTMDADQVLAELRKLRDEPTV